MSPLSSRRPARGSTLGFALVCALVICAGLGRSLYVHLRLDRTRPPPPLIDPPFAPLRAALPEDPRLGFVTDDTSGARLQQAGYALAPKVFGAPEERLAHGVASVGDPGRLEALCKSAGWTVVRSWPGGVALLVRAR